MPKSTLKPHQSALLGAAAASAIFWAVPGLQWAVVPLTYLNTHIHELCHALASVATGGDAQQIIVYPDGSGVTPVVGGNMFATAAAGYLGAAVVGMAMVMFSRREETSRTVLRTLAVALGISLLVWQHNPITDLFGMVSGAVWIGILWMTSLRAKGNTLLFAAQFLGVQQCLNSIRSVYDLFQISLHTGVHSDAKIMEQITGVPAVGWAGLWCTISVVLLTLGLRRAWSAPPRAPISRVG